MRTALVRSAEEQNASYTLVEKIPIKRWENYYENKGLVGTRKLGKIYKMRHLATNVIYAMKTIPIKYTKQALMEYNIRFILRGLCRFYICYHDIFQYGDKIFIIMDFIDSSSLQEGSENFSLEEKQQLTDSMVENLRLFHRFNIVHRNIKPTHIILRPPDALIIDYKYYCGNSYTAKKEVPACDDFPPKKSRWMAPELLAIDKTHIRQPIAWWKRADIYSMGLCIYALWEGENFPVSQDEEKMQIVSLRFTRTPEHVQRLIYGMINDRVLPPAPDEIVEYKSWAPESPLPPIVTTIVDATKKKIMSKSISKILQRILRVMCYNDNIKRVVLVKLTTDFITNDIDFEELAIDVLAEFAARYQGASSYLESKYYEIRIKLIVRNLLKDIRESRHIDDD